MDNLKVSGIYKIVNNQNGNFYVGSSKYVRRRWYNEHVKNLVENRHANSHLQNAWNKYGEHSFDIEVVEIVSPENLLVVEQKYLDLYVGTEQCYNIAKDVSAPMRGRKLSFKHKKAFCYSHRGKVRSAEHRKNLSESLKGNVISTAARKKISNALTGRIESDETKLKKSLAWIGKTNNPSKQLNGQKVIQIMKSFDGTWGKMKAISDTLGVSYKSVCDVVYGKAWTHITGGKLRGIS